MTRLISSSLSGLTNQVHQFNNSPTSLLCWGNRSSLKLDSCPLAQVDWWLTEGWWLWLMIDFDWFWLTEDLLLLSLSLQKLRHVEGRGGGGGGGGSGQLWLCPLERVHLGQPGPLWPFIVKIKCAQQGLKEAILERGVHSVVSADPRARWSAVVSADPKGRWPAVVSADASWLISCCVSSPKSRLIGCCADPKAGQSAVVSADPKLADRLLCQLTQKPAGGCCVSWPKRSLTLEWLTFLTPG